jgi:hypothetical protein
MSELERAPVSFETELATYAGHRDRLLEKAEGQFVVVFGDTLIGPYPTHQDAYTEGLRTFGNAPMLIKQVLRDEPVSFAPFIGVVKTEPESVCQSFTSV